MKFLLPVGGITDHRFGILTSPAHRGIPLGIINGMVWGADNGVFTGVFNPANYLPWLETLCPYADTCLFVLAPDIVGDAAATTQRYRKWAHKIKALGFPVGYAAQNGIKELPIAVDALFIGGTTEWKMGPRALWAIREAQRRKKHVHIGRVNNWRRYKYFRGLEGSEEFTCDGTKTRFIGTENAIRLWSRYMERPYTLRLGLSDCDNHC